MRVGLFLAILFAFSNGVYALSPTECAEGKKCFCMPVPGAQAICTEVKYTTRKEILAHG